MLRTAFLSLLLLPALAPAQAPTLPAPILGPPPGAGPTALLYVRLDGPPGVRSVWYQGQGKRDLATPALLGLRPGYIFRFEMNNLPELPGVSLYPTIEVHGSLSLTSKAQPRDFPAPVILTREDIQAALRGSLVTKVIYLEHPENATPIATTIQSPLETTLPANRDLIAEAREQGRPMLIFRVGQRVASAEELARGLLPGTVLFPGEASISRPSVPPQLPFVNFPWVDPLAGPAKPDDECIPNGGITTASPRHPLQPRLGSAAWTRVGLDPQGNLIGLQPTDAVAEYRDARGDKRIIPSNRVCICIPRYQVLRSETPVQEQESRVNVGQSIGVKNRDQVRVATPATPVDGQHLMKTMQANSRATEATQAQAPYAIQRIELIAARALMQGPEQFLGTKAALTLTEAQKALLVQQIRWAIGFSSTARLGENVSLQGTHVVGRMADGPEIVRAVAETRSLTACCHEIAELPDSPMMLFKCADKGAAQVGDVITFTLRYSNQGGKAIRDVAVSDSLSARLEYVAGSAEADRDAVFTTQANEVGGQILRWEINGTLQAGTSGILKFKARVR